MSKLIGIEHGFDFTNFNFSPSKKASNAEQKWRSLLKNILKLLFK